MRARLKAVGVHFALSLLVALATAACVFGLWFPYPFREIAGGRELFTLVVAVDVVCGPLLTGVAFNIAKPRKELARDLAVIAVIQLAALAYGVHVVAQARPVFVAFEVDRFRVVTPAEVDPLKLSTAPAAFAHFGWTGPQLIAVRVPAPQDADYLQSLDLSLQGLQAAVRPDHWRPYDSQRADVRAKAKPIAALKGAHPEASQAISKAVADTGLDESRLGYLPVESRRSMSWVALVDLTNADLVGYGPVDGF